VGQRLTFAPVGYLGIAWRCLVESRRIEARHREKLQRNVAFPKVEVVGGCGGRVVGL